VRLEEWAYQDGSHGNETVNYVVFEAGEHQTEAGIKVLAGKATADGSDWTTVNFSPSWNAQSHAYTQVMSNNDPTPTSTRITRTGSDSFDVSCHVEETKQSGGNTWTNNHSQETIGYVVTEPQRGAKGGTGESVASSIPTGEWSTTELQESYSTTPAVINRMQSFFGRNTTDIRSRNLSTSSFDVRCQEELSSDDEIAHVPEYVATMAIASGTISEL
jgi:hypothetical protein